MRHLTSMALAIAALGLLVSAATAADNPQTVKGRVVEVKPAAHEIRIATDEGKELMFRVNDRSKLEQKGKEATLDAFKKGMRVAVTYETRDGERRVVSMRSATVSAEEVQKEIRDALQAAKSYTFQHKDEYRQRLQRVIDRANEQIDQLQKQAEAAGAEAKKKYAPQIEQLRRLRDRAQAQAERVKSATPGAWEDLKAGVNAALEDLRKGFEKAGEHFR